MEQHTITLVQESWAKVLPISATAGALFYANLFEADPSLKALFKGDMTQQAAKLMQMISAAVGKLNDLDFLLPVLKQLGQRHSGYGVQLAHYDVVGASLLKTLEQGLGPAFTPATKDAWASVYGVMAGVMSAQTKSRVPAPRGDPSLRVGGCPRPPPLSCSSAPSPLTWVRRG